MRDLFLLTTLLNTHLPFSSCLVYWSVLSIITTTSNLALFLQFPAHCSCNKGRYPRECRYLDMTQQNGNFFAFFSSTLLSKHCPCRCHYNIFFITLVYLFFASCKFIALAFFSVYIISLLNRLWSDKFKKEGICFASYIYFLNKEMTAQTIGFWNRECPDQ